MPALTKKYCLLSSWPWLELALILAVGLLILQVSGPALHRWWLAPAPGQIGVAHLEDNSTGSCLSSAYLGYLPTSYGENGTWPLIVYLHGSGGRGSDPSKLLPAAKSLAGTRPVETAAVVLVPQCRPNCGWRPDDLCQIVDFASQRYRIDRTRVYLIGNSMGGFGAWDAAAKHPNVFAAIAPIAGGGSPDMASKLASVPTWVFHGGEDKTVPPDQSTKLVEAIRAEGGFPKLTLYPTAGHGIRGRVFRTREFWDWLFQQRLGNRSHPETLPATGSEAN